METGQALQWQYLGVMVLAVCKDVRRSTYSVPPVLCVEILVG